MTLWWPRRNSNSSKIFTKIVWPFLDQINHLKQWTGQIRQCRNNLWQLTFEKNKIKNGNFFFQSNKSTVVMMNLNRTDNFLVQNLNILYDISQKLIILEIRNKYQKPRTCLICDQSIGFQTDWPIVTGMTFVQTVAKKRRNFRHSDNKKYDGNFVLFLPPHEQNYIYIYINCRISKWGGFLTYIW